MERRSIAFRPERHGRPAGRRTGRGAGFGVLTLLAFGLASPSAAQSYPPVVEVTPEPVGLARSLVATRGGVAAPEPDLRDPVASGLVLAEPDGSPAVRSRAASDIRATTTYQLMQASGFPSSYQPVTTEISRTQTAQTTTSGTAQIQRLDQLRELQKQQAATKLGSAQFGEARVYTTADPALGAPTGVTGGTATGQDELSNAVDLYAAHMANMELLQAKERRRQLEREQQQRVFQLLQGKVEEIAELREKREEASRARLESMRDIRGPSALAAINLFEGLYVDRGIDLHQGEILRIDHHVYQDANPDTGLFYFAPKRYDLQWDPQNQYAMTVIYGMAGQRNDEGEVFMATRLQAGVDLAELRLAEELLLAYLRRNAPDGTMRFRELRPLPLAASSEVELFGGAQNQFTIPPESISVQGITSLLDSMDVSWATDVRRLLNVESLLRTDANIHGSITLHASGEEGLSRAIPLEIAVASGETFGRIPFDRANGWVNYTHYPVRLEALHALILAPEDGNGIRKDQPVVFSWDLHGAIVPPGGRLSWNAYQVPAWLESRAKSIWVKYGVDGSCEPCDDLVFTERFIPPPPSTRQLVFTTGDAFESTGAYQIRVHVRSPFLDPQRNRVLVSPSVLLQEDGEETSIARLFLTDREMSGEGAREPFYEFRLDVVMRDGQLHQSGWVPSRTLDYLLGSASLRQVLGYLPQEAGAGEPRP